MNLKIFCKKCATVAELVDEWVTLKPSLRVEEMYSWYAYIRFFWFFDFQNYFFLIFWKCYQFSSKSIKWLVVASENAFKSYCKTHIISKNQEKNNFENQKMKKSNVRIWRGTQTDVTEARFQPMLTKSCAGPSSIRTRGCGHTRCKLDMRSFHQDPKFWKSIYNFQNYSMKREEIICDFFKIVSENP